MEDEEKEITIIRATTSTTLQWAEEAATVDMAVSRWEVTDIAKEDLGGKKGDSAGRKEVSVDRRVVLADKKGVTAGKKDTEEGMTMAGKKGTATAAARRVGMVVCNQEVTVEVEKKLRMEVKPVTKAVDMDTAMQLVTDTTTQTHPITKLPRHLVQASVTVKVQAITRVMVEAVMVTAALAATTTSSPLLQSMPVMRDLTSPTCSLQL